jgi:hypothetical protein
MRYQRVEPNSVLNPYEGAKPFRAILAIEAPVTKEWQQQMSRWLVESGCLYMLAWGDECSSWDDSVDEANLERFGYGDIPDEQSVMTTWHANDTLQEVFEFAKNHASPMSDAVELHETVVFHIAMVDRRQAYEALYAGA